MNTFWQIILNNAIVATLFAAVAIVLGRVWKNPAAIHVLWLFVLLKLFTPPLFTANIPVPATWMSSPSSTSAIDPTVRSNQLQIRDDGRREDEIEVILSDSPRVEFHGQTGNLVSTFSRSWNVPSMTTVLAMIWICGACAVTVVYTIHIRRFARQLRMASQPQDDIKTLVTRVAKLLGLRRIPLIMSTSCTLPPLVWSIGIRPTLVLPSELFSRLDANAQFTIVAHELTHIRRLDHLVRWLELVATIVFWWHPIVWRACKQLRELEDQCCDGCVVQLAPQHSRTYAMAMLDTVEYLSEQPRFQIPLPTAIHTAGSLSKRIRMLKDHQTTRLTFRTGLIIATLALIPFVVSIAADPISSDDVKKSRQENAVAVLHGVVRNNDDEPLVGVRLRVAVPATDMRFDVSGNDHTVLETTSTRNGEYRFEIPGLKGPTRISVDAMKPGYLRLSGKLFDAGEGRDIEVTPGNDSDVSFRLHSSLYFSGTIVDEQGKPIPNVAVSGNANTANFSAGVERTVSDANGGFKLFNYPATRPNFAGSDSVGKLYFSHADYLSASIDDVYTIREHERRQIQITLGTGHKVTGSVLDADGHPVPAVMVKLRHAEGGHQKAVLTDANGKFILRGLEKADSMITVISHDLNQKFKLPINVDSDKSDVDVRLQTIQLPNGIKTYRVLGMQLTDATPELTDAFGLVGHPAGALILDPGKDSERLKIGKLEKAFGFFMVRNKLIHNVREFVQEILANAEHQDPREYSIRVVYTLSTLEFDGTRTQYISPTSDEITELKALYQQIKAE